MRSEKNEIIHLIKNIEEQVDFLRHELLDSSTIEDSLTLDGVAYSIQELLESIIKSLKH